MPRDETASAVRQPALLSCFISIARGRLDDRAWLETDPTSNLGWCVGVGTEEEVQPFLASPATLTRSGALHYGLEVNYPRPV